MLQDHESAGTTIPLGYCGDKSVATIEIHGPCDERGRCEFTVYRWFEDFHLGPQWRAQCFFSSYQEQMASLRAGGRKVVVVRWEGR